MTDVAAGVSSRSPPPPPPPLMSCGAKASSFVAKTKQQPVASSSSLRGGPRFEAFVMTGDKMLRLDSKISANFAKMKASELPEHVQVASPTPVSCGFNFDDEIISEPTVPQLSAAVSDDADGGGQEELTAMGEQCDREDSGERTAESSCTEELVDSLQPEGDVEEQQSAVEEEGEEDAVEEEQLQNCTWITAVEEDQLDAVCAAVAEMETTVAADEDQLEEAKRQAKRLFECDVPFLLPNQVVEQLCKTDNFSTLVNKEYMNLFNFTMFRIDAALRFFLCCLFPSSTTAAAAPRRHLVVDEAPLRWFSARYHRCNPCLFGSEEQIYCLAGALCALDNNLNAAGGDGDVCGGNKMSCHDFIELMSRTAAYPSSKDLLKVLYHSVKSTPLLSTTCRGGGGSGSTGKLKTLFKLSASDRTMLSSDRLADRLQPPHPDAQAEYKKGWVMRKCIVDKGGKRVPFGRRSWRMFFAIVKGTVLYLQRDETADSAGCAYITYRNAIGLHHAYAVAAADYTKRKHVFKLYTSSYAEFLFQTSEPSELNSWITAINFTAACFSAPKLLDDSFRASGGHCPLFARPYRPTTTTKLSLNAQFKCHQCRLDEIEQSLDALRDSPPCRNCEQHQLLKFAEREVYLLFELRRYRTYVTLLQRVVGGSAEDDGPTDSADRLSDFALLASPGGRSGQSDRLSYCAAIGNCMAANSP